MNLGPKRCKKGTVSLSVAASSVPGATSSMWRPESWDWERVCVCGKSAEVGGDLGSPPHTACTHNQPRDPSAAQTEALSPLASSTQSSREDVSRLEFKSPGLTLRLLRVSKGPLRFKLGTLRIFHAYHPPETLPCYLYFASCYGS